MSEGPRRGIQLCSCLRSRPKSEDEHSQSGRKGFSRIVYCNDPDNPEAVKLKYKDNNVWFTKYTMWNFIPKSLFEQFRRVANIYFLVVACVSYSPLAPYSAPSVLLPLLVVIGATMLKEGVEDWRRRKQSVEANNRIVQVYDRGYTFKETKWKKLRVGDLVKVCKDEYFPADLILISSSNNGGICYVETMNLDGETNLKLKQSFDVASHLCDETSFKKFRALIKCEDPNEKLYSFVGTLYYDNKEYPLSLRQMLLRDSKLKNTEYIYGVVVFTGDDTKVMKNVMRPPSKRSKIEKKMDKIICVLFSTLVLIAFVGSMFFGIETKRDIGGGRYRRWYLRPDDTTVFYDPKRALLSAFFHFLTALMLYGYLIPISLYISIEIVKVLQSIFINQDPNMYYEETGRPAHARTSNLNEELGQVQTILSDKTGTLTCNSMEFVKCSIGGIAYGRGMTEVERTIARREKRLPEGGDASTDAEGHGGEADSGKLITHFNFRDERIMDFHWIYEPHKEIVRKFFYVLAMCHTVIPVKDERGEISYEAESQDEAALVIAAKEVGFEFLERTQTSICLYELTCETGKKVARTYELLQVLEFSSDRKRMSVIVRDEENRLFLLCKGADSVILRRLADKGRSFESQTKDHIKMYAQAGLRTLVIAYRELDEGDYMSWEKKFKEAKTSNTGDRGILVDKLAEEIERELILLGATAIEDKLQDGVSECIDKLHHAGINIWVLTGDKRETAINVGYTCSLLTQDMEQIVITLDSLDTVALERGGQEDKIEKVSTTSIENQIKEGIDRVKSAPKSSNSAEENALSFALIIDGRSLDYSLKKNLEKPFFELAILCSTVICCRSSPKQKALVTRLVKLQTRKITLSIGDGANDVGMIQEADIGVGISGVEGMQAAMASDFSIAQFQFLERLLLVHGHWCYRRISMMICYFFYKNIAFGFTLFWFEAHASFSGQTAYNDWYMSFYNVFFTSLPVIALGVFDQDVPEHLCLKYLTLYREGVKNVLFSWHRILGWMLNGVMSSIIIFVLTTKTMTNQAFRSDGQVVDYQVLGVTMYTCIIWVVNCQMALSINYFTWIQHLFIWGSIALWYIFLLVYGSLPPTVSTTAYRVLLEACAPSSLFWLVTPFVVICSLLPYFCYRAFRLRFMPMHLDLIQTKTRESDGH